MIQYIVERRVCMDKILKRALKVIGIYVGYLLLTIIVFYITGMYIWTTPPTSLVLRRMLVFPLFLTAATVLFMIAIKKWK